MAPPIQIHELKKLTHIKIFWSEIVVHNLPIEPAGGGAAK